MTNNKPMSRGNAVGTIFNSRARLIVDGIDLMYSQFYGQLKDIEKIESKRKRYEAFLELLMSRIDECRPSIFRKTTRFSLKVLAQTLQDDIVDHCENKYALLRTEAHPQLNSGKRIEIKNIPLLCYAQIRLLPDDEDDYRKSLNGRLRDYDKKAQAILKDQDPQALQAFILSIEEENDSFLEKNHYDMWEYRIITDEGRGEIVSDYCDSIDYEIYTLVFKSPDCREKISELLKRGDDRRNIFFEEYEIQSFHTALNNELKSMHEMTAYKEATGRRRNGDNQVPNHFTLQDDPEHYARLDRQLNMLIKMKYVDKEVTSAGWHYYCTGSGKSPEWKIRWLKGIDELGYFVKHYFNDVDMKYQRAARCFLLENGETPDPESLRKNACKKIYKTEPMDKIISVP